MSQKGKKKKRKPKIKKYTYKDKDWYEVFAPKSFDFIKIGEIVGIEKTMLDRTIETLLFDFTDDFNDINLKLKYKVITVNNEAKKCDTVFLGHQYTNDYIRSLVGRGSTKVQYIGNFTTKDNFVFRVTIVCVTLKRARSSQQIIIRKIIRDIMSKFSKSLNHEKFVRGMVYGEFQNQIARVAKTIYPLSSSTVVKSKLISFPEGAEDTEVPDDDFDIVEVEVKRSRKSEIRRTERINVKKYNQQSKSSKSKKEKEEETEDEEEEEEENEE